MGLGEADNAGLLSYSATNVPGSGILNFNPNGSFTYTNTTAAPGTEFGFDVVGTAYGLTLNVASLEVTPVPPNTPPTSDLIATWSVDSANVVRGNIHASDADGDTLTYSVTGYGGAASKNLSNGGILQVDSLGNWTYIPPISGGVLGQIGDSFTVYVIDGRGGQTKTDVVILTGELKNGAFTNIGTGTVTGGVNIPGSLFNSYSLSGAPAGVSINPATGAFTYNGSGTASFSVIGTTANGNSMTVANFSVQPNQNPTITSVTGSSGRDAFLKTGSWIVTVSDPEGAAISGSQGVGWTVTTTTQGSVSVSRTGTVLGVTTFTVTYTSNTTPNILQGKKSPSESFTVTFYDGVGGSVQRSLTF